MSAAQPFLERLSRLAPRLAPNGIEVASALALAGGASQELWRVMVRTPEGETPVVLRRSPDHRLQSALSIPIEIEAELPPHMAPVCRRRAYSMCCGLMMGSVGASSWSM